MGWPWRNSPAFLSVRTALRTPLLETFCRRLAIGVRGEVLFLFARLMDGKPRSRQCLQMSPSELRIKLVWHVAFSPPPAQPPPVKRSWCLVAEGLDPHTFFGDLICGFQLKEQTSWRFQKTRRFEKSINPEVWFVRDWPRFRSGRASAGS